MDGLQVKDKPSILIILEMAERNFLCTDIDIYMQVLHFSFGECLKYVNVHCVCFRCPNSLDIPID